MNITELYERYRGWKVVLVAPEEAEREPGEVFDDLPVTDFVEMVKTAAISGMRTKSTGSIYGDIIDKKDVPREK